MLNRKTYFIREIKEHLRDAAFPDDKDRPGKGFKDLYQKLFCPS